MDLRQTANRELDLSTDRLLSSFSFYTPNWQYQGDYERLVLCTSINSSCVTTGMQY